MRAVERAGQAVRPLFQARAWSIAEAAEARESDLWRPQAPTHELAGSPVYEGAEARDGGAR
jgi:hypothetical protein